MHTNDFKSCYIRPLVFYGANTLGLGATDNPVQVAIAAWPWGTYLGEEGLQKGIRVHTATYARHHVNAAMCLAKATGYYVNSVLAHDEAAKNGYDEALMLDVNGLVTEGPGENLFIVRNGKLSPPLSLLNWKASPAIPSFSWPPTWAMMSLNAPSPETPYIPRMKHFSPAPPPK